MEHLGLHPGMETLVPPVLNLELSSKFFIFIFIFICSLASDGIMGLSSPICFGGIKLLFIIINLYV